MSQIQHAAAASGTNRRTLLKGAAWSVPVLAVTMAAPAAMASAGNFTVAWGPGSEELERLMVSDDVPAATAGSRGPNSLFIHNGAGALPPLTMTIMSTYSGGLNLRVVQPRGVGVRSVATANRTGWNEVAPDSSLSVTKRPYTVTSIFDYAGPIAGNFSLPMDVGYQYTSEGNPLSSGTTAEFTLSLSVTAGTTRVASATATLVVPL